MVEVEEKGGEGSITEGKMMGKRMRRFSIFRVSQIKTILFFFLISKIKTILPLVFPIGPFILNRTKFSPLENCLQSISK